MSETSESTEVWKRVAVTLLTIMGTLLARSLIPQDTKEHESNVEIVLILKGIEQEIREDFKIVTEAVYELLRDRK